MGWKAIAALCRVEAPRVGNCVRDLERAGGGFGGYEVIFQGLAVCRLVVEKGYAPLLASSRGILEYRRMLPDSETRVSETPTLADKERRVSGNPILPEGDTRVSETPTLTDRERRVSQNPSL